MFWLHIQTNVRLITSHLRDFKRGFLLKSFVLDMNLQCFLNPCLDLVPITTPQHEHEGSGFKEISSPHIVLRHTCHIKMNLLIHLCIYPAITPATLPGHVYLRYDPHEDQTVTT